MMNEIDSAVVADEAPALRIIPNQEVATSHTTQVDIRGLNFFYGKAQALREVNLAVPANAVTARSGSLSWLKSPTATAAGSLPTAKLVAGPKPPAPLPNNTATLPALAYSATARSGLPSWLKSPTATATGSLPTATVAAGPNPPTAPGPML